MATYSKVKLSSFGSTYYPINIGAGTNVPIHTTGTSSTVMDEVWLWVYVGIVPTTSIVEINVNGYPFRMQFETSDSYSKRLFFDGLTFYGNGTTGATIDGTDLLGTLGICFITGHVNRITP